MPAKRVYKARPWEPVRRLVLERDGYRCQIRGHRCLGRATEVDHIVALVDGGAPFDPDNLRAACKPCNAGRVTKDRAENGWRRGNARIILVWGPPCGGKSTYVRERASSSDVVLDFDTLAVALGSADSHGHSKAQVEAASAARNALLARVRRGDLDADQVWIVSANPTAVDVFPHHTAVLVDPGKDEAQRRAIAAGRPDGWLSLIDDWYYRRTVGTTPLRRVW